MKYPNQSDYQSLPNYQTQSDYQSLPNYQTQENYYQTEPEYGYQAPEYPQQGQSYQQPVAGTTQPQKPPVKTEEDPLIASKQGTTFEVQEAVDDRTALRKAYIPKFQALFGEFLGTMILVAVGCGSATVKRGEGGDDGIGVAITFGFIIMSLVQSFVPISGGHFNPIVTMCMCLSRRMSPLLGVGYFVAQILGGICGAGIIQGCVPDAEGYGATKLQGDVGPGRGFLLEAWMTSVLIFVVYSTAVSSRAHKKLAPLPIAVAVAALVYFGGSLTGGSLNPARSFGPAVVSGEWDNHWLYWIGPWIGGLVGWICYQVTHFQPK